MHILLFPEINFLERKVTCGAFILHSTCFLKGHPSSPGLYHVTMQSYHLNIHARIADTHRSQIIHNFAFWIIFFQIPAADCFLRSNFSEYTPSISSSVYNTLIKKKTVPYRNDGAILAFRLLTCSATSLLRSPPFDVAALPPSTHEPTSVCVYVCTVRKFEECESGVNASQ